MPPIPPELMAFFAQEEQPGALARAFSAPPLFAGADSAPAIGLTIPGLGNSSAGQLTSILAQGLLPQLLGPEFVPGQFSPTVNLYDYRRQLDSFQRRQTAGRISQEADVDAYFRILRGLGRVQGIDITEGSDQEKALRGFAKDFSQFGSFLADQFPEIVDQALGSRGSAQVLSQSVVRGGRYTLDPVSGRIGLTGESGGALSKELFENLFGPGQDVSALRGLGAGRSGQLYDELVRRGLGPSVALSRDEAIGGLEQELGRPEGEIKSRELRDLQKSLERTGKSLAELDPQALDAALRSFDAAKAARTIENMSGAVAAMRDIFGDVGRPNAPMIELLNGLQTLTQGGLQHMSPAKLEESVRQTYNIARSTGIGLEGILTVASTAGQITDQLGLERAFAPDIAQSSTAFAFGYGLGGAPRVLGGFDKEQALQADVRLRAQAAASPLAARLAAVADLSETLVRSAPGGDQQGFAQDSEAFALSQAIKRGESRYEFGGQIKSIFQSEKELLPILQAGGVNVAQATQALTQDPRAVQETINRFRIQDLAREGQADRDLRAPIQSQFFAGSAAFLAGQGLNRQQREPIINAVAPALFEELQSIYNAEPALLDTERRTDLNRELATRLRDRLGDRVANLGDADLNNLVATSLQQAESFIVSPRSGLNQYKRLANVLSVNSDRNFTLQRRVQADTGAITRLQTALSGVGQADVVQRISDYLQDVGPDGGTVQDFVFRAIGGIPSRDVAEPLGQLIQQVSTLQKEYEDAGTFIKDPELLRLERERILGQIRQLGPEVSSLIAGNPALSQETRALVDRSQAQSRVPQALPAEQRAFDAQRRFLDAEREFETRIERRVGSQEDVQAADIALSSAQRAFEDAQRTQEAPEVIQERQDALEAASQRANEVRSTARTAAEQSPEVVEARQALDTTRKRAEEARRAADTTRRDREQQLLPAEERFLQTQREADQAQRRFEDLRTRGITQTPAFREAQLANTQATTGLRTAQEELATVLRPQEVADAEQLVSQRRKDFETLDRQVKTARERDSGVPDAERQRLDTLRTTASRSLQEAERELEAAVTTAQRSPEAQRAQEAVNIAQVRADSAATRLGEVRETVGKEVEQRPEVIEARQRAEGLQKLLPDTRRVAEEERIKAGPAGVLPVDQRLFDVQRESVAAQREFLSRRQAGIESSRGVQQAAVAERAAKEQLTTAEADEKALFSPTEAPVEVRRQARELATIRQQSAPLVERVKELQEQITKESAPGGDAVRLKALIAERKEVGEQLGQLDNQARALETGIKDSDVGKATIKQREQAEDAVKRTAGELRAARDTAAAEIDKLPEVKVAREEAEKRFKSLNEERAKQGLPALKAPTAEQLRFEDARDALRKARDAELEKRPDVVEARIARDAAAQETREAEGALIAAEETPAVVKAREQLSVAKERAKELDREISKAVAGKPGQRPPKDLADQRRKAADDVARSFRALSQTRSDAAKSVPKEIRERAQKSRGELERSQKTLSERLDKATKQIDESPAVKPVADEFKASQAAVQGKPAPGVQPLPQVGRAPGTDPTGRTTLPSDQLAQARDVRVSGQTVALTTQALNVSDVRDVTLSAREVRLNRLQDNLDVPAKRDFVGPSLPDAVTGASQAMKLSGTLKIENLEQAIVSAAGTRDKGSDPRTPAG